MLIAAETQPAKISLFYAAYIMGPAALTMLLLSTLGFLGMVYVLSPRFMSVVFLILLGQRTTYLQRATPRYVDIQVFWTARSH